MNHDHYGGRIMLAMENKGFGGYMLADAVQWNFMRRDEMFDEPMTFNVRRVNADILIYQTSFDMDFSRFEPIDAMPQFVSAPEKKSIKDFNIFAPQLVRTQEIIVEPESVAECLDLIRRLQAPQLAQIRERNRMREAGEAVQQLQFHAQVMSIAA